MSELRVLAVVVAHDRAALLRECLDALARQTRPLDGVVGVDNASADATPAVLRAHPVVTDAVRLPRNVGGAGGFAAGIARALARGADLVWLMDDDTVATPVALSALLAARASYPGTPALLAARAVWRDGREHPMNRPRARAFLSRAQRRRAAAVGCRPVRTASFVATLLDARAIRADGLPKAAYFLWNDDFEYTARLLRRRVGLYVPAAVVVHKTRAFGDATADPGARLVLEARNKAWALGRSSAFDPLDRLAYTGSTLLRWARTVARSPRPGRALARIARGLAQSARPPAPTVAVLAGTPVAGDVEEVERMARLSRPRGGRAA